MEIEWLCTLRLCPVALFNTLCQRCCCACAHNARDATVLSQAYVHLLGLQGRVATLQSLSGTGSLRVGAEFISKFLPGRTVYLSNPTWCAHQPSRLPCCMVPSLGMQEARTRLASVARPRVD